MQMTHGTEDVHQKNMQTRGTSPGTREVPEPVLKEIKEAKGKVHSMGSQSLVVSASSGNICNASVRSTSGVSC